MDFKHLFLSFEGRTRRLHFWLALIILWVVEGIVMSVTVGGGMSAAFLSGNPDAIRGAFAGTGLIGGLICLALIWPSLAVQVKRWHDRDKTGWMVLINLIPVIGFLWTFIECGFLDGTPGPNKFGPSPKGLGAAAAA
ncbi:MAG TPA: DUF805 domain-containing protein [Caulobacteraceae bacterium]|jgi:uncharacterized membrane protein YhaH (DUF805 family)